jgi:hypothetical protein
MVEVLDDVRLREVLSKRLAHVPDVALIEEQENANPARALAYREMEQLDGMMAMTRVLASKRDQPFEALVRGLPLAAKRIMDLPSWIRHMVLLLQGPERRAPSQSRLSAGRGLGEPGFR